MKKILICLLAVIICFTLSGCGKTTGKWDDSPEYIDYGTVEKETVFDTIDKFNVELSNNRKNYFANNDYMIAENGLYWYGLYEDITCYVKPATFNDDINNDITKTIAIRYDVNSKNEQMALDYIKLLIKANNPKITDEEVTELMTTAKSQASDKKTAHNGKGITVGVLETADKIEYQIARIYAEEK